ncbi:MAG: hypothetical protein DRN04_12470 [Thermoprotei archaeon]|nr:MAG: hypothetical protein DRN04_12470 [Thermoprotei archaeon]
MKMIVEIISTGKELLVGEVVNTNAVWIAKRLTLKGFTVRRIIVVGDSIEEISSALEESMKRANLIILTGGLGPTSDDVTREAVAQVLKRKLVLSKEVFDYILRERKCGLKATEKMSYVIEGCYIIFNKVGSAPGMIIEHDSKIVVCLPGPPHELKSMFPEVEKYLEKYSAEKLYEERIRVSGLPEISVFEKIYSIAKKYPKIYFKTRVLNSGEVEIYLLGKESDIAKASNEIRELLKGYIKSSPS